jgi:predicted Zn finger-like uncharacterized protein
MAVELRCPECRAKLRLKAAPEAGSEVECPKCGTVFPAPEAEAPDEEAAAKADMVAELKKVKDGEKGAKAEKGGTATATKDEKKPADEKKQPKKRRAKKKETSRAALIGVISSGVLMLAVVTGVLIWYFTRTSKAVEMLYYAPEDAQFAIGLNIGHAQKYPEFYKSLASVQKDTDFKFAGDIIGKATGNTDLDGLADYIVKATSVKNGWSIVYRTKTEFDGDLSKVPGATKKSLDGKTYYSVANLLPSNQTGLLFAPTNRLIVVCPSAMESAPVFKKIINGHGDSKEKTMGIRMAELGKRVTRGTFWQMTLFDDAVKPGAAPRPSQSNQGGGQPGGGQPPQPGGGAPPQPGGGQPPVPGGGGPPMVGGGGGTGGPNADDEEKMKRAQLFADAQGGAQGIGAKASLGSREVRFEVIVWHKEGDKHTTFAKKMKEHELGKGDEGTPPKWFKDDTTKLGDRKVQAQLLSNISFGTSGQMFFVRSSVETVDLQQSSSQAMGEVLGIRSAQGGMSPGGGPAPGGGGAPPQPGGGGPPPMPKQRRRFGRARA